MTAVSCMDKNCLQCTSNKCVHDNNRRGGHEGPTAPQRLLRERWKLMVADHDAGVSNHGIASKFSVCERTVREALLARKTGKI